MSTELTKSNESKPALTSDEMFNVLSSSLYPGAQRESIKLVLDYCVAANLDPILKPVHIVPMYCATGQKDSKGYDVKAMRDVVMPGIGLYRIQASRSKEYAGVSEPKYGEDVTETLDGVSVTYPKWCKVTVKRKLSDGTIAEFSSMEFWKENYATRKKDSVAPNAMWQKRPYGQINKCSEAQALRKAFPEIGSAPTADEMEGKEIDITEQITETKAVKTPERKSKPEVDIVDAEEVKEEPRHEEYEVKKPEPNGNLAEEGQVKFIQNKLNALKNTSEEDVLKEAGLSSLDSLTLDGFNAIREALRGKS